MSMGKFVFGLSLLSVAAAAGLGYVVYREVRREFPQVSVLKSQYVSVKYQGRDKPAKVNLVRARPAPWVSIGEISKVALGAVVVSEDWAFYSHKGYDANQIREAIREDWEAGGFRRGASTITQQVAKNVFLTADKNLWRKFKELFLAMELESTVGKRKILETYLNVAEWGEGVYGIGPAARLYFKKHPSELTAREGAFLAMLLPSPKKYSVSFRRRGLTPYARRTVNSILRKMSQAGYLTEEQRDLALATPLPFEDAAIAAAAAAADAASPEMSETAEGGDQEAGDETAAEPTTVPSVAPEAESPAAAVPDESPTDP